MSSPKFSNRLLLAMLIAIVIGAVMGGVWPSAGQAVHFIGELFIKALLMLVVPLVVASVVVGIARLGELKELGGMGSRTVAYYLLTTGVAVVLGLVLVTAFRPGHADTEAERIALRGGALLSETGYEVREGRVWVPEGLLPSRAFDDRYRVELLDQKLFGELVKDERGVLRVRQWVDASGKQAEPQRAGTGLRVDLGIADKVKGKSRSMGEVLKDVVTGLVPKNLFAAMANNEVLPLIVFSLFFGAVLARLGEKGKVVRDFFEGLNEAVMHLVHWLMVVAPVGIAALIAGRLGEAGGFSGFWPELLRVGKYALIVVAGLLIHGLVVLPLILRWVGRRPVIPYSRGMAPALTTAFSTASSSATLPLTLECATEQNKVSERASSFVIPLGATMNMDGTALYEAVAAVFIAQVYGIELGPAQLVVVFLTATLAAIGAAGIPEAGLVTMVIVLQAVGLPVEGISLLLIIDWFLDRCRTTVNVWGDAVGAAVVDRLTGQPVPVAQASTPAN